MRRWIACLVAATFVLGACGGGGGSGSPVAGIDRTGAPVIASYGTVSAFGSVVVNGVHYDTTQASFTIDDNPGASSDLAIGDVVLVKGTLNSNRTSGTANTVSFENNVVGPVTLEPNLVANTLVVLGQLVRVNADTSFAPGVSLASIKLDDILEVSGLVQSDESISATRIGRRPAGGEFQVTGVAVNSQITLRQFFIGTQIVSYQTAPVSGLQGNAVANGDRVRVRGTLSNGVLIATRVALRTNTLGGASGESRHVEGIITRFASATDFDVAGLKVKTNSQTTFEDGNAANLALNVKVEAEGTLDDSGVLVASKIEVRQSAPLRIVAAVDSVNTTGSSFVVLGVTVKVDAVTRIEDQSSQQVRPFSLANLAPGDFVEVRGSLPTGSSQILATLVERMNPQLLTELSGLVESKAPPLFAVLGVNVTTSAGTQFHGITGVSDLNVGDFVRVKGQKIGDRAVSATDVERDD